MVGMTTTGCSTVSDYQSRSVAIDVVGVINQATSRVSNYRIKVPLSQMSVTMRHISCQGGKVVNVELLGHQPLGVPQPSVVKQVKAAQGTTSVGSNQDAKAVVSDKKAAHQKKKSSRASSRKGRRARK